MQGECSIEAEVSGYSGIPLLSSGLGKGGSISIQQWNGCSGSGRVVLSATTVQRPGRRAILGLRMTTGRRFTISGSRNPELKSHTRIVPTDGYSLIAIEFGHRLSGLWVSPLAAIRLAMAMTRSAR